MRTKKKTTAKKSTTGVRGRKAKVGARTRKTTRATSASTTRTRRAA